jgi:FixJ family two-component response regulator
MNAKAGVFVVDDDPAIRNSLVHLISAAGHTVHAFGTATAFLQSEVIKQPGCLLLDLCLPDLSGIELQEELNAKQSNIPVIIMSGYGDIPLTVRAMKLGAVDFLMKPVRDRVLFAAINNALALVELRLTQSLRDDDVRARLESLTPRERDVLNGVLFGRLNKQIARELGISEKTVKVHRGRVMAKMGVRRVVQLAQLTAQVDYRPVASTTSAPPRVLTMPAWRRRRDSEPQQQTM